MGSAITLAEEALAVDAGGLVTTQVRVRNTGEVVDQFHLQALGPASRWTTFEPPELSLFPHTEGISMVRIAPPRKPEARAGTVRFGVRAVSAEDPPGSAVAEGDVSIGAYQDVTAELVPRTTRGRSRGRHSLAVQNLGNRPLSGRLLGDDPERRVRITVRPSEVAARPGAAAYAVVLVRPRRRFLRGPAVTHSYTVRVEGADPPVAVPGAFLQEALVPRWMPKALLALAALVVAWYVFLRPTIQSAATRAVEDDLASASQLAASQAVAPALAAADDRLRNVETALGITPGAPLAPPTTPSTAPASVLALGDPYDARLEVRPGQPAPVLPVAADTVLSVTDLVLENPAGDAGTVIIQRGESPLLRVRLEHFRDLDYHFVAPLVFPGGSEVRFLVECDNPGPNARACTPALYLAGFLRAQRAQNGR